MHRDLPSFGLHYAARLEVCSHRYVLLAENIQHPLIGMIDIDPDNIRTSQHNVALNNLESRIQIIKSDPDGPIFPLEKLGRETSVSRHPV
jgi:hypothetical protein